MLRDTPGFAVLHVGPPDLVEDLGLARVHMPQNAHDGAAQVARVPALQCVGPAGQPRLTRCVDPLLQRLRRLALPL